MADNILPAEILTEEEIKKFIDQANINTQKIIGDSKFTIPDPSLPGIGMLIKLWIKESEKSFGMYLAPVIIIKDSLKNPTEIKNKVGLIKDFIRNPINSILNESINPQIQNNFFLPVSLSVGGSSPTADFSNLNELVSRAESQTSLPIIDTRTKFPYVFGGISKVPLDGEYIINNTVSSSPQIYLSSKNYNGDSVDSYFSILIPGDTISLESEGSSQSWIIKKIIKNNDYYAFDVTVQDETISQEVFSLTEKTIYLQVQQNTETEGSKALLSLFSDASGKIKFPIVIRISDLLSIVGVNIVNIEIFSKIKITIGSFDSLKDDNPIKIKIKDLEIKSGWNFERDVLSKILDGKYPSINYPQDPNSPKSEKQKAREELLSLAKLFEMLVKSPATFFKILASYLKLLILPLQVVISTIESVFETVLQKPLSILSLIPKLITNPIFVLGDLIAGALLSSIRSYIEPSLLSANISWNEIEIETINGVKTGRGLRPLIRDIIIGKFKCSGKKNTGNASADLVNSLEIIGTSGDSLIEFTNFSYYIKYSGNPESGEIVLNYEDLDKVNFIKISSHDFNVNSSLVNLVELTAPGSEISIPKNGEVWVYVVNKGESPAGDLSYFEYSVSLKYSPNQLSSKKSYLINSQNEKILSTESDLSTISFKSSDPFLQCLIENYLPIKLIAVWESLKGVLGLVLGFAVTIPFLIKSIFKSIFSKSIGDQSVNILRSLSDPNLDSKIDSGNPTDINSDTNSILSTLISVDGIDIILQDLAKKDPRFLNIQRKPGKWNSSLESNTNFESISMTEFSKKIKILLTVALNYRLNNNNFSGKSVEITYLNSNGTTEKITRTMESSTVDLDRISKYPRDSKESPLVYIRNNIDIARALLEYQTR